MEDIELEKKHSLIEKDDKYKIESSEGADAIIADGLPSIVDQPDSHVELEDVLLDDNSHHKPTLYGDWRDKFPPSIINTIHLSIGFLFVFLGYSPTQNLMTNLHPKDGSIGLALLYFAFAIGCLISPILSKKIGLIKSLLISGLCYSVFIFCSIDKLHYFYLPAAVLIGIAAAVLWTSQPTYLSRCAPNEKELGKYSSIFQSVYSVGVIAGNGISGVFATVDLSSTTMLIIFASFTAFGALILGFLRPMAPKSKETVLGLKEGLVTVFLNFKDKYILLLLPLLIQQGQSQGFFFGTVPVLIGLDHVGFAMMLYGVFNVGGSTIWGKLHDSVGKRAMVICMAIILPISIIITILAHRYDQLYLFYIACSLNGAYDSLQTILIFSTIATIYPTDNITQFSSSRFTMSLSTTIAFFVFQYLNLYALIGWLLLLVALTVISMFYIVSSLNLKHQQHHHNQHEQLDQQQEE